MDVGGRFLRMPARGVVRVEGLATCQDCGFEARDEMLVGEDDGTMRRRCGACMEARYPGLVEDWPSVRMAWLPELSQAAAAHLVRTLQVLELLAEEVGKPRDALARAVAGARAWGVFLDGRESLFRASVGRADAREACEFLDDMGVDGRALSGLGLRIVPRAIGWARVEGWLEAGTYHGLSAEDIERTGGFHGR